MKLKFLLLPFVFGSETDALKLTRLTRRKLTRHDVVVPDVVVPELSAAPGTPTGTSTTTTTTTIEYAETTPGPEYDELPVAEECRCPETWTAKYTVTISTSNKYYAGTDDTVYIDIIGTDGQTGMVRLDNEDEDDFEMGRDSIFEIEHEYKGSLEQIQFFKGDRWQVEKATVSFINKDTTESFEFDCQHSKMEFAVASAICKLVPT